MKKIILSVLLLSVTAIAGAQEPVAIVKQGHFSVGGTTTQRPGAYDNRKFVGWVEQEETGQSYRADHAFVDFQIPADAKKLPLVYVHGYGGSGVCWQMTPDGREGFATLMLEQLCGGSSGQGACRTHIRNNDGKARHRRDVLVRYLAHRHLAEL